GERHERKTGKPGGRRKHSGRRRCRWGQTVYSNNLRIPIQEAIWPTSRNVSCDHESAVKDFFFSSRRRHTRSKRDWSSDVCSSDLRQRLGRALHGKQVELEETVDNGLLGGFVVEVGTYIVDGSLDGQLAHLRARLAGGDRKSVV